MTTTFVMMITGDRLAIIYNLENGLNGFTRLTLILIQFKLWIPTLRTTTSEPIATTTPT